MFSVSDCGPSACFITEQNAPPARVRCGLPVGFPLPLPLPVESHALPPRCASRSLQGARSSVAVLYCSAAFLQQVMERGSLSSGGFGSSFWMSGCANRKRCHVMGSTGWQRWARTSGPSGPVPAWAGIPSGIWWLFNILPIGSSHLFGLWEQKVATHLS